MRHLLTRFFLPPILSIALPFAMAAQTSQLRIQVLQGQGSNDLAAKASIRPRIKVTDSAGNPVQGAQVQFKAPDSGATVHYPDNSVRAFVDTDAGGFASAPVAQPLNEGELTIEVTVRYRNVSQTASIVQRNVNPCPANMRGLRLEEDTSNISQHDADARKPFFVKVRLYKECRPAPGIPVSFTVPPSGAAGALFLDGQSTVSIQTDASGYAVSPQITPNGTDGDWELRVSAGSGGEVARLAMKERNTKALVAPPPKKSNAWKYALAVIIPGAAVGGLCGSGHCGGGGTPTPTTPTMPASPCAQGGCTVTVGTPTFGHK